MSGCFKDLIGWQKAVEMTLAVYQLTATFPPSERFRLADQLCRAATSAPSNIAEGYGRSTRGEYLLFLGHARGSCNEVETQLVIARALGYGTEEHLTRAEQLVADTSRLLGALIRSLRSVPRQAVKG